MKQSKIILENWSDTEYTLLVGGDFNDILKVAKKLKLSNRVQKEIIEEAVTQEDYGAVYWCFDQCLGIVWFRNAKIDKQTISHESTHMVDYLLQHIGATLEMEARAYTQDYLEFKEIPRQLKRLK